MIDPVSYATAGIAVRIVDVWLKPTLQALRTKLATKADIVIDLMTNSFRDYLDRSYERHQYLPTIVFPNQKKLLKSLYISLRVATGNNPNDVYLIDSYPDSLFVKHKDVLIVDTAGMGKSTIVKYLFIEAVEKNKGIPVVVELRKLSKEKNVVDFIHEEINGISNGISKEFLAEVICRGDFVFFLDGYDEIPAEHKSQVTADLQSFKSKANKNKFVLTSRDEPGLTSFVDFQRFNIQPLIEDEAFSLIRKYAEKNEIATSLINKLGEPEYQSIKEFLQNPLLVSLLYKSYEYKPTIPLKKPVFYRQVYEALFENHDFSKGGEFQRKKKSGLDIDQFHTVLRALGFVTYKEDKTEFDSDELLRKIDKAKDYCSGLSFANSDLLNDLVNQVPLLIRDGIYYRWAHKSIQEYFTACFVCNDTKSKEVEILNSLYRNSRVQNYLNMLLLCHDIDIKTFSRTVIRNLLSDFFKISDAAHKSLGKTINSDFIEKRVELTAFNRLAFYAVGRTKDLLASYNEIIKLRKIPAVEDTDIVAHWLASELAKKYEDRLNGASTQRMTSPTGICVCHHQLKGLIEAFAISDSIDFVVPLTNTPAELTSVPLVYKDPMVILDDDPDNPLNNQDTFEAITQMISEHVSWRFDHKKATLYLAKIEQEIESESDSDYSF